jgi:hypothetical protein
VHWWSSGSSALPFFGWANAQTAPPIAGITAVG